MNPHFLALLFTVSFLISGYHSQLYGSGDVCVLTSGNNPCSINFNVPLAGTVSTIDSVSLNSPDSDNFFSELQIELVSPSGTSATLKSDSGSAGCFGGGPDFTGGDIIFSDSNADTIVTICQNNNPIPVPLVAAPVQPLSTFTGELITGGWSIRLTDRIFRSITYQVTGGLGLQFFSATGGDPHFNGFHQQTFDFLPLAREMNDYYSLISHESFHVNMRYKEVVSHRLNEDVSMNYIGQLAFVDANEEILVDAMEGSPKLVINNLVYTYNELTEGVIYSNNSVSVEVVEGGDHRYTSEEILGQVEWYHLLENTHKLIIIEADKTSFTVLLTDLKHRVGSQPNGIPRWVLNTSLGIKSHSADEDFCQEDLHGVLGQTYGNNQRHQSRSTRFELEGTPSDYKVTHAFASDFLFSKFSK